MPILNPWMILAVILAIAGAFTMGEVDGDHRGSTRVQSAWDRTELVTVRARATRIAAAAAATKDLQAAADEDRRKQDEKRDRREHALLADISRLQSRPARPGQGLQPNVPGAPGTPGGNAAAGGGWSTGAGLFRDDAEFLVRLAAVANIAKSERDDCRAAYQRAKSKVDALNLAPAH